MGAAGQFHLLEQQVDTVAEALGHAVRDGVDRGGGHQLQGLAAGRRRQRIGVERARMGNAAGVVPRRVARGLDHIQDIGAASYCACRQPASQDFGHRREVRLDAIAHLGAAGRRAEPGDHLVDDEQRVIAAGDLAEVPEELRLGGEHAHVSARRLDDGGCDIVVFGECALHESNVVVRDDGHRRARFAWDAPCSPSGAHGGVIVPAVEVLLELEYLWPAGEGARQPHGHHGGLGAGAMEAHLLHGGHEALDPLGPTDLHLVGEAVVRALLHLFLHDPHDVRVGMAQEQGAMTGPIVDVLVAVDIPLAGAGGVGNEKGEGVHAAGVVGDAVGEEVPGLGGQLCRLGV